MKYYLYTIPKSGTYLMAAMLEQIGLRNSGWHIMVHEYMDTNAFTDQFNSQNPIQTKIPGNYVNRLSRLGKDQFCFGHLCPSGLPLPVARNVAVLRCYRNPKDVMLSEFIDFRFRRTDVVHYHRDNIADDHEAFESYVEGRGVKLRQIYQEFLVYEYLLASPDYQEVVEHSCYARLDFSVIRDKNRGFEACKAAFSQLGLERELTETDYRSALEKRTKTHSGNVADIDRQAFWTERSSKLYAKLGLDELYDRIGQYV